MLKGWIDRVCGCGFAWASGKIFEEGLLLGKKAFLIMSTAIAETNFSKVIYNVSN